MFAAAAAAVVVVVLVDCFSEFFFPVLRDVVAIELQDKETVSRMWEALYWLPFSTTIFLVVISSQKICIQHVQIFGLGWNPAVVNAPTAGSAVHPGWNACSFL